MLALSPLTDSRLHPSGGTQGLTLRGLVAVGGEERGRGLIHTPVLGQGCRRPVCR